MDINIELNYEKKGVYGLARVNESKYITISNSDNKELVKNALDTVHKGLKILSSKNIFNPDMYISTGIDYRAKDAIIRITYNSITDLYDLYIYDRNSTDIEKIGKKQLVNKVLNLVEMAIYK